MKKPGRKKRAGCKKKRKEEVEENLVA